VKSWEKVVKENAVPLQSSNFRLVHPSPLPPDNSSKCVAPTVDAAGKRGDKK